ncbi:hypothetical protein M440DRAFT_1006845 [Trichoderma longibrachiatum ATCC 18648]|uniref:Uncharacterized protein n=1 Tax=Trichoderma longibrachiatum ATCC 18648 TaxID=983965 RepID=A0A2T4CHL8_TRILO|nr:hypothetical protein M440DRAFT_1006845 [Trichoderma longibrachiatum ATCC 18648]
MSQNPRQSWGVTNTCLLVSGGTAVFLVLLILCRRVYLCRQKSKQQRPRICEAGGGIRRTEVSEGNEQSSVGEDVVKRVIVSTCWELWRRKDGGGEGEAKINLCVLQVSVSQGVPSNLAGPRGTPAPALAEIILFGSCLPTSPASSLDASFPRLSWLTEGFNSRCSFLKHSRPFCSSPSLTDSKTSNVLCTFSLLVYLFLASRVPTKVLFSLWASPVLPEPASHGPIPGRPNLDLRLPAPVSPPNRLPLPFFPETALT